MTTTKADNPAANPGLPEGAVKEPEAAPPQDLNPTPAAAAPVEPAAPTPPPVRLPDYTYEGAHGVVAMPPATEAGSLGSQ